MAENTNKNKNKSTGKKRELDTSRREFMKRTGIATGGVIGGALLGGYFGNPFESEEAAAPVEKADKLYTEARMFFTRYEDFVVLEQASERIYPEDDHGPGAIELGVPYFIDKQLGGQWGLNARDYRQAPFVAGDASVDQSRLIRADIFINGIRQMNDLSQSEFDTSFDEADVDQQIIILEAFENDEVEMKSVSSASFFDLLRMSVIEGVYADPLYGGNRNMEGWRMREYPGAVASYLDVIDSDEFVEMNPISLTDYQQK